MKTSHVAVAVLAALVVAVQVAFLQFVVATPLASFVRDSAEALRPTFEESILVEGVAKVPAPVVQVGG